MTQKLKNRIGHLENRLPPREWEQRIDRAVFIEPGTHKVVSSLEIRADWFRKAPVQRRTTRVTR